MIGVDKITGRKDITTHQGPAIHLGVGVGSGPGPRLCREGAGPDPGRLRGLAVLRGGRRRSGLLVLPLIISIITGSCPLHLGLRRIISPGPSLIIIMADGRVWTRRSLVLPTCPDVRSSCPRSHHKKLRREPSQWSRRLPDQQGWTTKQVWRAQQTQQLWPPQQVWRAQWTQQRCRTKQVTSQQGITTWQQSMSPRLWTTRQVLPTRHRSMTWQVWTQHSHRTQQWTTQQGVTGLLPRVPQQGILQLQDRT